MGNWQKYEFHVALDRKSRERTFPLILILLPGSSDPPLGFLSTFTWIDRRQGLDDTRSLKALFRAALGGPPVAEDRRSDPRSTVKKMRRFSSAVKI